MDLFKPSKKVLGMIASGEKEKFMFYNPLIFYHTYTGLKEDFEPTLSAGVFESIREYYHINHKEENRKRLAVQLVWNVFGEATKNCIEHSLKGREVFTIGFYFGVGGVCYGFNDNGNYFKNDEIKSQYENKLRINKFDKNTLENNCQSGVNQYIYPYSDLIEVDSKKGILYCVQFKESIIAPEGKNGNQYCWDLKNNK
jgi:hypothetical protein